MPGTLTHSPARVVWQWLVDQTISSGIVTDPEDAGSWPLFRNQIPGRPEECVIITDEDPVIQGRTFPDMEVQERAAFQITVRSKSRSDGWSKINALRDLIDVNLVQQNAVVSSTTYLLYSSLRASGPFYIGTEESSSRVLHTVNYTMSLGEL